MPVKSGLFFFSFQVEYVDLSRNSAMCKLMPRIDYTKKRGVLKASGVSWLSVGKTPICFQGKIPNGSSLLLMT